MSRLIEKLSKKLYDALYNSKFKEKHRMEEKDFTRNRKLGFGELCLAVLKGTKRGLQVGIRTFLEDVKSDVDTYSKAAFSKARQKINPSAFEEIFRLSVEEFYSSAKAKTFRAYRVCAIDGTELNLPNTEELLSIYGSQPYGPGTVQAQARVSVVFDVLNHIVIDAKIKECKSNERAIAQEQFAVLNDCRTEREILLMDRGYPSQELLLSLENYGFNYVIRVNKKEFFREIRDAEGSDVVVVRKVSKDQELTMRLLAIELEDGKYEYLISNIMTADFSICDFKLLYGMRWGVETAYDTMKNRLQIEKFSGITPICILQDFYAHLFLLNLLACVEYDCADEVKKINASGTRKYEYKLNVTQTVAELRECVVELVVTDSARKKRKLLNDIKNRLLQNLVPIRNGRSSERKLRHPSIKFPQNRKLS